jgi:hypothetical protein
MTQQDGGKMQLTRLLTYADQEFYEVELKVLEKLKNEGNDRCVTAACKELGVDQYDFKDRWGPLLRSHPPSEILENIHKIRPLIGKPIHEIAINLGMNDASVRTMIKKLSQTTTSRHVRTKENLTHRILSTSGCSLKEAQNQVAARLKGRGRPGEGHKEDTDSLYSDTESDSSVDSERSSKSKRSAGKYDPSPVKKQSVISAESIRTNVCWYEQSIKLCAGMEAATFELKKQAISAESQLKVLREIVSGPVIDVAKACEAVGVDGDLFKGMWVPLLKLVPARVLDASIFAIISLLRLGYGITKISSALGVTANFVNTILTSLNLELGPCDNHSYDLTLAFIHKETPSESVAVELCSSELARKMLRRARFRAESMEQLSRELKDEELVERVMWLYERGLGVELICAVLMVPRGMVRGLAEE